MTEKAYQSQTADRVTLRFDGSKMKLLLKQRAAKNRRPMNSEILHLIDIGLAAMLEKENASEGRSSEALVSKTHTSNMESDNDLF